jgi:Holliday junction resolvase
MMVRRAARRDTNEPEIIEALRAVGATVQSLDERGVPDLVVGFRGVSYLIEVKTAKGKLTRDQVAWHAGWKGQVAVVRTVEEALAVIGAEVSSG